MISAYSRNLEIDVIIHILEPHPINDEILLTCDLIGRIAIWNI